MSNTEREQSHEPEAGHSLLESEEGKTMGDDTDLQTSLIDVQENGSPKFVVERPIYSQKTFDEGFEATARPKPTIVSSVRKQFSKCVCTGKCVKKSLVTAFPFIGIMKNYKIRTDFPNDIVSGLTIGIMHIPQGMAYGMLTTLAPVFGLYTSFFPVLVYFLFGSSLHVSVGTFAVASLMVGAVVDKGLSDFVGSPVGGLNLNATNTSSIFGNMTDLNGTSLLIGGSAELEELKLSRAMAVTFVIGLIQLVMGAGRLGFVTLYLSDPLISGFTTGAACHVFTSQIKHVFGVHVGRYNGAWKLIYTYKDFFMNIPQTNSVTLIASIICMVIIYVTKEFINQNPKLKPKMKMPVPIELIAVVLGTLISYLAKLEKDFDVVVVGDIPTGLPAPALRQFTYATDVISDAFAIAIVTYAVSVSMAKILAKNHEYEINSNQELLAYGMCNVFSSFFSSFCCSASLSRSLVQEQVGGKTQVAGLISCGLLLVVLLAIGPYFRTLPNCILASIIIVALKGMFKQIFELKNLWRISLIDFCVWLVAFLATILLDVDLGLLVGVVFNLLTIVCRSQRPYACLMGQMPGTDLYRDMTIYKEAQEIPRVKIFRFETSLFFVNLEHFRTGLYKLTTNPRKLKIMQKKAKKREEKMLQESKIKDSEHGSPKINGDIDHVSLAESAEDMNHIEMELSEVPEMGHSDTSSVDNPNKCQPDFDTIVLDCSTWSFIDSMGIKFLKTVIMEYKDVGIRVLLALCKGGIREMMEKTGFYDHVDRDCMFVTLHDAVLHAQNPSDQVEFWQTSETAPASPVMSEITEGHTEDIVESKSEGNNPVMADGVVTSKEENTKI